MKIPGILKYLFRSETAVGLVARIGLAVVVVIAAGTAATRVSAQSAGPIRIVSSGVTSEFPEGMRFKLELESDLRIDDVRVTFEVGARGTTQYAYLDLDQTTRPLVNGELFQRTNTNARYIPPGTMINYWFEITDETGETFLTDPKTFRFEDARFEWDEVTLGAITILYHGPVRVRAERLAEAAVESLHIMGPVTGAEIETQIVMTLYNNNAEMIGAVVARSLAASRELITEGQAFDLESVVLVLAGRSDIGTATHEMTHILTARAAGNRGQIPLWLNEGLAEYGNLDKTLSYERFLEWAEGTGRLIPLKSLISFPGDPNLTLVAYGQGRSAVEFMIEEFGIPTMARLLATLGTGVGINRALEAAYGFDLDGLEDRWREAIGADPYIEPTPGPTPTPNPVPTPAYKLLTLPPESGPASPEADEGADADNEEAIVAALQPAEAPEPTTPAIATQEEAAVEQPDQSEQSDSPEQPDEDVPGGTCSAPVAGSVDGTAGAWLVMIVGLVASGRFRAWRRFSSGRGVKLRASSDDLVASGNLPIP
ncbi:MAG: peptidase MA family metallohydrolase [Chloroflexi bacterium]|nr:peptidase MA family metallohydrolase [Chloroflexota bacterium]